MARAALTPSRLRRGNVNRWPLIVEYGIDRLRARFSASVDSCGAHGGCHLWTGGRKFCAGERPSEHYGKATLSVGGRQAVIGAHRLAWMLHSGGPVPDGLDVLHRCHVRLCVNPEHLKLGTNSDNMRDWVAKRRGGKAGKRRAARVRGLPLGRLARIRAELGRGGSKRAVMRRHGLSKTDILHIEEMGP
jgi:hypothetical protein